MLGSDERIALGLEFGILGPLRLTRDGEELPIAGEKVRGLLAILLLEAGRPVPVERLVDELWEDAPPATARQSLYVHVARLRRSLAADGSDDSPLTTGPRGYMLQPEEERVDATRFRRLVASAREARRAGHAESAADGYRAALSLWRGDRSSSAVPSAPPTGRASLQVRPDSLVEIDPAANRVISVARVGKGPEGIAFTRDAAWVVTSDRTVDRVDLRTRQVRAIGGIPVARAVAATLGDDVWVSSFEAPWVTLVARHGRVVGEDDLAGAAAPPRVRVPGSAEALTVGGGFLWVTSPKDSGGRNTVSRIDLRTRRLVSTARVGRLPLYAAFGYGSLWVSNYKGDSVSVVRPGSERPETVPVPYGPLGIAAGEGGIWVVTFWSAELVRIDPETRRVRARIPIGDGPLDVAVGGGAVWTTDRDSQTITKVDPATDKVVATIHLPVAPYGIGVARGRLWVTTQRCGSPVKPCG